MATYIALFIVINLTLLTNCFSNKKIAKIISISTPLVFLFFMMVFRDYSVGGDIHNYKSQFDIYLYSSRFAASKDFGFYFLLFSFAKTFQNFRFFLAFEYLIFYVSFGLLLYFYSRNTQVALLVFLFCPLFELSVSGLRQTLGIALCLFAIISFSKIRKPFFRYSISFLLWAIACTMHACLVPSVLVFILYRFRARIKFTPLYVFLFLLCAISSKYLFYILDSFANLGYGASGVFLGVPKVAIAYFLLFLLVLYFVYSPLLKDKFSKFYDCSGQEPELSKYLLLFFVYVLFQSTVTYNLTLARFGTAFSVFLPLVCGNFFSSLKGKKTKIISYGVVVIVAMIAFWYENVHHDACNIFPFIWGLQ